MNSLISVSVLPLLLPPLWAVQPGAVPLLPANSEAAFRLSETAVGAAALETVEVTGQPFAKALRITAGAEAPRPGGIQVSTPIDAEMKDGDVLLASFYARSLRPAETADAGQVNITFRAGRGGFSQPLSMPVEVGSEWRKVQFPFNLLRPYAKSEAQLVFTLGRNQSIEIGGIQLDNYGATKRVSDLPCTRVGYAGSEPDAAWRKAANERIERIRKANLTVTVKDKSGKPVQNASVSVRMRKHAFGFGTAVNGPTLTGVRTSPEDVQKYKDHIVQLFNKAVMENDLKWPQWAANRELALTAVQWLRQQGIPVRGHTLVWPSWRWSNVKPVLDAKDNPPVLAKAVLDHIEDEAGALRGQLVEWDVINEPFSNHDIMDVVGKQVMVDWFKAARRADPNVKLYINDYDILAGNDKAHQDHYYQTIEYLIEFGAPVEGIGFQGHFSPRVTPPEEVLKRLDRFAVQKREFQITEFDVDTNDELTQAEYTRDFMTTIFSHPSVSGFMMWGFWERRHWKPKAAMIRGDWTLKPNGEVYKDLVFKQWWTNTEGRTKPDGKFETRGFLGDYEIEVSAGGRTKKLPVTLQRQGASAECVLD